jgi:hypothetical protein
MVELEDQYRYFMGGYYGVSLMDEYPLKEFVLKDIENYIKDFIEVNPIKDFNYQMEALKVKENTSDKTKLQDALLLLNKMNASMELVFLIKARLKKMNKK